MACKVRKVVPSCTRLKPHPPSWPRAQQAPSAALGPSRSVFLGRFFLPKPATRSKFTLEFTLETRLLGKLSVVPVLGVRYQVLGDSTGENIHNLKSIYLYKRVLLYLVLNYVGPMIIEQAQRIKKTEDKSVKVSKIWHVPFVAITFFLPLEY